MESPINELRGVPGQSFVGIFYCYPSAGESVTAPSKRTAPYQETHATKCLYAALEARNKSPNNRDIVAGDMVILNDGGKYQNLVKCVNALKNIDEDRSEFALMSHCHATRVREMNNAMSIHVPTLRTQTARRSPLPSRRSS